MASARRLRRGDAIVRLVRIEARSAAPGCVARRRCRTLGFTQVPDQLARTRTARPLAGRLPIDPTATVTPMAHSECAARHQSCAGLHHDARAGDAPHAPQASRQSPPGGALRGMRANWHSACVLLRSKCHSESMGIRLRAVARRTRVSYSGQRRPPNLASCKLESRDVFFIGGGSWCKQRTK